MDNYVFDYSQYKTKINKKSISTIWLFLFVILLAATCIYLTPKKHNLLNFYFVEIDNFPTYQQALNLSNNINSQNGAGYIFFDGNYHVLASFYSSKKNAENVLKNIRPYYKDACIFSLSSNKFKGSNDLTVKQNSSLRALIDESEKTMLTIEKISTDYDSGESSFKECITTLTNLFGQYSDTRETFQNDFINDSKFNIIKEYENNMFISLKNLTEIDEQRFSQSLRYELINLVVNRYYLLSCF